MTNADDIKNFMNGRNNPRVLNSAKRSQEILKYQKVHPKNIIDSYIATYLKKREYMAYARAGFSPDFQVVAAAVRAKDTPRLIKVMSESLCYLNKAKAYWKGMSDEIAYEINEKIESSFDMDYIATAGEYKNTLPRWKKQAGCFTACTACPIIS